MVELPCPGVVVVWCDEAPRHAAHRIPDGGLAIDQTIAPWDARLVGEATRISAVRGTRFAHAHFAIARGRRIREVAASQPVVQRIEGTVVVAIGDVRPFEQVALGRLGPLVVGGSLGPIVRELDVAANAEEHVSIKGAPVVAHALARYYASKLGTHAWFRPGGDQHLDHFLSTRGSVRTVVLELTRPLFEHDVTAIRHLLETDLRFVVVRPDDHYLGFLPPELARGTLEIPALRFDELPTTIAERVAAKVSGATIRPEVIEHLLDRAAKLGEEAWHAALAAALDRWAARAPRELGLGDLAREFP